ncbi:MAG TPA: MFS transporter permease [Pseudomonas xinjiangensis]|uniref:MFS transporter permease n=2 Tax=root TaxID=1 RepID=A0A7V1FSS5_9GAMM|nr:MFS transporter permease [Halopseudomonas xinjiangensis]HEC48750.1 MFS transporter permease [Halopseudomonas xinjiangensis]
MNDWASYQLQDFIPFTADIYVRLLERMGETFWPLHLLTLALGAATLVLALSHRTRLACLLPAPLWAFVAIAFFIQRYAELNWAGGYVGYAFISQAVLLVLIALTEFGLNKAPRRSSPPVIIGTAITLFGLIILPLMAPLTGGSWYQAEVFGIHADPTAITTLGLALILLRGLALWAAAIIPALWVLISALTLQVLHATGAAASGAVASGAAVPGAVALFTVLAFALLGVVWKSFESQSAR